jgi:hypothetical protein
MTKYYFGVKVGNATLDPIVIWGQFIRNVTSLGIGYMTIGSTFIIGSNLNSIGSLQIGTFQIA